MVEAHGIDDHEPGKIVLVRVVVAMPTNHVKWGVVLKRNSKKQWLCEPTDKLFHSLCLVRERSGNKARD